MHHTSLWVKGRASHSRRSAAVHAKGVAAHDARRRPGFHPAGQLWRADLHGIAARA